MADGTRNVDTASRLQELEDELARLRAEMSGLTLRNQNNRDVPPGLPSDRAFTPAVKLTDIPSSMATGIGPELFAVRGHGSWSHITRWKPERVSCGLPAVLLVMLACGMSFRCSLRRLIPGATCSRLLLLSLSPSLWNVMHARSWMNSTSLVMCSSFALTFADVAHSCRCCLTQRRCTCSESGSASLCSGALLTRTMLRFRR